MKTTKVRDLLISGQCDEAYNAAKKLEVAPANPGEAAFLLGVAARRTDRLQESLQLFDKAQTGGYSSTEIERQKMMALFQGSDLSKSEPYLEKLTQQNQTDPEAEEVYECLVKGWLQQHRLEDARRVLVLWRDWKPNAIPPRLWLAEIDQQMLLYSAASGGYRTILKIDPEHRLARLMLAANLFRDGKPEESLELYQKASATTPEDPVIWLGMAQCYLRLGESAKAKLLLEKAAGKELPIRERGQALGELAKLLFAEKKYPEVIRTLEEALPAIPQDSGAYSLLAQAYSKVGDNVSAQINLKKSEQLLADNVALATALGEVQKRPKEPKLRLQVAELVRRMGGGEDELRWLITALRMDSKCIDAHVKLVRYYQEHGQPEIAARHRAIAEQLKLSTGLSRSSSASDK